MSTAEGKSKVTAEAWREVSPLLATGLELEEPERAAWLAGLEKSHPEAMPLLRGLLASHERAERSHELETVSRLSPRQPWRSDHAAGERIGPFELVRPLGRGGMGEVWLARQVDGRVEREVALKLPGMLQQGDVWRERFRRERDILARLEHPHIARFYDAGVSEAGQPWLAMECVFGTTLLEHVAARKSSIAERLALFRQVLAAVAHAHRHLVVHRDLKPGNLIVDATGVVKLLDFGIAKLADEDPEDPASGELTRLGGRVMTLRYAAPEQVAGGSVTTATDIFALGVVLHELVAGLSPYRAVRSGKPLAEAMLLQEPSTLPSRLPLAPDFARQCGAGHPKQLARALSGDLDAIVLKAMRRDPAQRYASVELFDADVLAHLQKRPVTARAGTWRYLGGRFVARPKLPIALAGAIAVSLIGGLVLAEGERREAVAERARAERHFASVRRLANSLIFDVHATLARVPGSLAAREMLIAKSVEYLDALAAERSRDPGLLLDLGSAYRSIASIQGDPREANRGNVLAAVANYEKSDRILQQLLHLRPDDPAGLRESWRTSLALAAARYQMVDPRWRTEVARAVSFADRISAAAPAGHDDRSVAAFTRGREAYWHAIATGRTPAIEATVMDAVTALERLRGESPPATQLRHRLAILYGNAGVMLAGPPEDPKREREGLALMERGRALAAELRVEAPSDAALRDIEWLALLNLARHHAAIGELQVARSRIAEATALIDDTLARHPDDVNVAINRLVTLVGAADIAQRLDDVRGAAALSREVLASVTRLPKDAVGIRNVRMQVAEAKVVLGYALVGMVEKQPATLEEKRRQLAEARELFGEVSRFVEAVRAEPTLGAIPEHKLREFAAAQARLERAARALEAR